MKIQAEPTVGSSRSDAILLKRQSLYQRTLVKWWKEHPEQRSVFTKRQMSDPKRRAFQAEVARKVLSRSGVQEKSLRSRMKNPIMHAGPENHSGKFWRLRDPRGRFHEFRNLSNFIRDNPSLFLPEDVQWVGKGRKKRCRAFALRGLHPSRKVGLSTWKGWTWISIYERRFNDGLDLLDRVVVAG
jgi:hypothetical protein